MLETDVRTYRDVALAERSFFNRVYLWMMLGLLITGLTAFYVISTPSLIIRLVMTRWLFFGLIIGELVLVGYLSARVAQLSFGQLVFGMGLYAVVNGVTLSVIFLLYTHETIVPAFMITAGTFGAMSLWGFVTKRDLTGLGHYLMMGLIGLIFAGVVNIFFYSSTVSLIASVVGVLVFTLLTAYDTQKLKAIAALGVETEEGKKAAMMGAFALYLDFINLFLYILRLLNRRK